MKNRLFLVSLATMLTVPVVVASVPIHIDAATATFKDVSASSPYYDIINRMAVQGIISGYEDGNFRPNEKITRKHAAALISRAKGSTLPQTSQFVQFKDVAESNPNFQDIKKLQQAGLFKPDSNGNFNPNKALTRAEMARVLVVAFELEVKANYDFADVPSTHAYSKDIRALYSNGVTTGDNGKFMPNDGLSRAHYAVFMYRAMNLDKNHVATPGGTTPGVKPAPNPTPKPDVKPAPKPDVKPTPTPKPGGESDKGYGTGLLTDKITHPNDIPKPPGLTDYKEFRLNQEKEYAKIRVANGHNYVGGFSVIGKHITDQLVYTSENLGITEQEFVKIINWAITTGEVYDGGHFSVYIDFTAGQVRTSGINK